MQEILYGIVGLSSQLRERTLRAVQHRAQQRALQVAENHVENDASFLALRSTGRALCARIHGHPGRVLGWLGHVVSSRLELWPCAEALSRYIDEDVPDSLASIDGIYALAVYESGQDELLLAADPYGICPLYYLQLQDGVLFSTSVDLLIHSAPVALSFNPVAAAEYMHFHYCLGDKTLAQEVKRVPQGKILAFNRRQGHVTETTTFSYDQLPLPEQPRSPHVIERMVEALEDAIRRRRKYDGETVCLLSGGYDSRAISGLLRRIGCTFTTLTTYGDTGTLDDPEGARLVADVLDVPNTYIPLPADYLGRHWRAKCILTDFSTTMHTWLMLLAMRHDAEDAVNFDGLGGDVTVKGLLLRAADLELLRGKKREALVDAVVSHHRVGEALADALVGDLGARLSALVRESVAAELARWQGHPNSLSFFVLSNRTRRAIGVCPCCLLEIRLRNVAPFLDREVLACTMAINPEDKLSGALYRDAIRRIDPRLADLPSSNDATWPAGFARRTRPRMSVQQPDALRSYIREIERAMPRLGDLLDATWLAASRRRVEADAASRWAVLPELQCIAELALWLNTYEDKIAIESLHETCSTFPASATQAPLE